MRRRQGLLVGIALGVAAIAARTCNNAIRGAWRADNLSDTEPSKVSFDGGPWGGQRIHLQGLPTVGARIAGRRRWVGFDARDGYYAVTSVSAQPRTATAIWVGRPNAT